MGWIELGGGAVAFGSIMEPRRPNGRLVPATALVAFLAGSVFGQFVPDDWLALPPGSRIAAALVCGRAFRVPPFYELPAHPLAAALIAAALPLGALERAGFPPRFSRANGSLYPLLPALPGRCALALPVARFAVALPSIPRSSAGVRRRRLVFSRRPWRSCCSTRGVGKQPLAIATLPRFLQAFGRARVAHPGSPSPPAGSASPRRVCCALASQLLAPRPVPHPVVRLFPLRPGRAPAVGSLPLLNAAVLHFAPASFWLWTWPRAGGRARRC